MTTPHKGTTVSQAPSTPPLTPVHSRTSQNEEKAQERANNASELLTPPTSPQKTTSSSSAAGLSHGSSTLAQLPTPISPRNSADNYDTARFDLLKSSRDDEEVILKCVFDTNILRDDYGREQIYGYGAWSTVYQAATHTRSVLPSRFSTMPTSPVLDMPMIVAVKKPARRDAIIILKNEAKILTHLSSITNKERYVVPFYGTGLDGSSLVLGAIPHSLEDYIKSRALVASQDTSRWYSPEPIFGTLIDWLLLAHHLVSALVWLHEDAGVVHGDVKPANILLFDVTDPPHSLPFLPLLADFTSGQLLYEKEPTPNTLSAVTREYAAPELLKVSVLSDPKSTATTAADVFSMAVTLLVAATGELSVYPGSVFQRQVMATQGWQILNYVRNGPQGTRIPRHGVVEKVIERAVLKSGMGRVPANKWLEIIDEIIQGEPSKL